MGVMGIVVVMWGYGDRGGGGIMGIVVVVVLGVWLVINISYY